MAKFTIKMSAKADVFSTVVVEAEGEEEAVAKALNPALNPEWAHYPGSAIQGTATTEEISVEPGDPLPLEPLEEVSEEKEQVDGVE
jgi:hypothetical protein